MEVEIPSLSQQTIIPLASPLAKYYISLLKARDITQLVCLSRVAIGEFVFMSHILTVVSPEPVANNLLLGEKATDMTESVWPNKELDDRVMGLTLKLAMGW